MSNDRKIDKDSALQQQNQHDDPLSDQLTEHPSTTSIGFGNESSITVVVSIEEDGKPKPTPAASFPFDQKIFNNDDIYDCLLIAFECSRHKRLALQRMSNQCFFLPIIKFNMQNDSLEKAFKEFCDSKIITLPIGGKISTPEFIDEWRVRQPKTERFFVRIIIKSMIEPEEKEKCCIDSDAIRWLDEDDLKNLLNPMSKNLLVWGLEPFNILHTHQHQRQQQRNLREFQFEDILQSHDENMSKLFESIVDWDEYERKAIYNEFLVHCYPSQTMSFPAFISFAFKISILNHFSTNELRMMYKSFDRNNNFAIDFCQLIIGIILMLDDNDVNDRSPYWNEQRLQSLFRYYDLDDDNHINMEELNNLFKDYHDKLDAFLIDRTLIPGWMNGEKSRNDYLINMMEKYTDNSNDNMTATQLEKIMNELSRSYRRIPHMWQLLYRMPFNVLSYASVTFCYRKTFPSSSSSYYYHLYTDGGGEHQIRCQNCLRNRFALSNQVICLSYEGEICDIIRLVPFSERSTLSFIIDIPDDDIYLLTIDVLVRLQRLSLFLFAIETFRTAAADNNNGHEELLRNWFFPTRMEMLETIRIIVQTAMEIFAKEERCIHIQSPCYVFGDLHGNFKDLITYSQYFWKCSPFLNTGKYLFLGDYVDRGDHSIEVVIFLFCFKILAPNHFFMIRGNHEIREVQRRFTFFAECQKRLSVEIWDLINDCFDCMPLAAIIDDCIVGVHGGIPATISTIEQIYDIPVPLSNPLRQNVAAWEMMWNDPIDDDDSAKGFCRNFKRGTGYLFGENGVKKFLRKNAIDFIIRAHEVFADGFYLYSRGKVITIFSSSGYSFPPNSASISLISNNKIRIIKI
ncbi:Serine/threonine-phosphatase-like protein [Euroglyphus maynei]|uniref:Serine/threonine-protein phosphatase n=1 Tax=Euroglyphus maynei TaxID=6958 RepID=A0A1Y3BGK1_EURMA|nr:Serine/threonine-phosphatase-like protein [Euroglyphus maynei]